MEETVSKSVCKLLFDANYKLYCSTSYISYKECVEIHTEDPKQVEELWSMSVLEYLLFFYMGLFFVH